MQQQPKQEPRKYTRMTLTMNSLPLNFSMQVACMDLYR